MAPLSIRVWREPLVPRPLPSAAWLCPRESGHRIMEWISSASATKPAEPCAPAISPGAVGTYSIGSWLRLGLTSGVTLARSLTSPCLHFLVCKMQILLLSSIQLPHRVVARESGFTYIIPEDHPWHVLRLGWRRVQSPTPTVPRPPCVL